MVRPIKIYKGESPVEEIQQAFKDEMKDILENAALRMGCSVEELKCRVDNLGRVEVQRMTPAEMVRRQKERGKQRLRASIRRMKGIGNG